MKPIKIKTLHQKYKLMQASTLMSLLNNLVKEPHESEWLEFKHNFHSGKEIGERISALANGACLRDKPYGYLRLWSRR